MTLRNLFNAIIIVLFVTICCNDSIVYGANDPTSRWIIVYKDHALKAASVKQRPGKVRRDFDIIPGYCADMTVSEVAQIKKNPSVALVEPDYVRHVCESSPSTGFCAYEPAAYSSIVGQNVPYGIDLVHARDVWPITKGSGIKIADIDTGIDLTHPDVPNVVASVTFTDSAVQDTMGHGTHTAGTMAAPDNGVGVVGVAPQAGLLVAQVFDSSGQAYDSDVISGIEWAVRNGAKVINMSLGGSDYDSLLEQACSNAVAAGVIVVASAGNNNSNSPFYPAAYSSVICVSAVDQNKQKASFSNYGSWVSVCAPGVSVLSSVPSYASWNGSYRDSIAISGSAAGVVTASAVYCGLGNSQDFPASVKGKIAHVRRGGIPFSTKVSNAVAAGAVGVIISNNAPGTFLGTLNGSTSVVVIAVSMEDGDDLVTNDGTTATIAKSDYAWYSGTSMSAPHVSGVAALLMGATNGKLTPAEFRSVLQSSAEDLGDVGRDDKYGYGLVNAKAAVTALIPTVGSITASPTFVAPGNSVAVEVDPTASTRVASVTANGVILTGSGNKWTGNMPADLAPGNHIVNIVLKDTWGNTVTDGSTTYKTARVVGINGRGLNDSAAANAENDCMFVIWGNVSQISTNSFVVNDGSGYPVTVNAAGHSVMENDFVRVRGVLHKGASGLWIQSSAADVSVIR